LNAFIQVLYTECSNNR